MSKETRVFWFIISVVTIMSTVLIRIEDGAAPFYFVLASIFAVFYIAFDLFEITNRKRNR